jgi:proton-translocating NADH-quinone oxidoreductase chain N|tara:strand:+ start:313 stop:1821 length:1509 start_codon:yes stop_codon:yes gene_type:complete
MNVFEHLFINDLKGASPELFLAWISLALLGYGVFYSTARQKKYPILAGNLSRLTCLSLFFSFLLLVNSPIHQMVLFHNCYIVDPLSQFLKCFLLLSALASLLISIDYMKKEGQNAFEPIVLVLLSTLSILFLVSSYDLLSIYLAIELQSLSFYVLAASKRDCAYSTEAGLKYFLLGAFSSGILLFGCSMIYGFTGSIHFEELGLMFTGSGQVSIWNTSGILLGILFLAVGFLFKLSAVPFHMWAPDVYEGSPSSMTAFFLITPKMAIMGVFIRLFLYSFYEFLFAWQSLILLSSMASMVLACFAGIAQTRIKRLLVYSAIGHVGYILLGFACGSVEGLQALLIYLVVYLVITLNMFTGLLCLRLPFYSSHGRSLRYIGDLHQLVGSNPLLSLTLCVNLFSIAGIPPLAGFCSKFYLFFAALSSALYLPALLGVITSVISCFYYLRLIKILTFEKPDSWIHYPPMDKEKAFVLGITSFFILFFFLYPSPLFIACHQVAASILV